MEGLLDEKRNKELIILADLEKKENPAVEKGMDDHLQKKLKELDKESNTMEYSGTWAKVIAVICICFSLFQIYTGFFGALDAMIQRCIHLSFGISLVYLLCPTKREWIRGGSVHPVDLALAIIAAIPPTYILVNYQQLILRAGTVTPVDTFMGVLGMLMVIEAARRIVGLPIVIVVLCFLAYGFFGRYMPGPLAHRGLTVNQMVGHLFYTTEGVFGIPMGVSSTFIFLFILFGAYLEKTGLGKFFIDIANAIAGWASGGPAKVAVISSALQGTISGSSVANVVGSGSFTIPMMKKTGYKPEFAGAVEAAASTGGQIMPPIMGAAAFLMAEYMNIPYAKVAVKAILPAVLYFTGIFIAVHLEAKKLGLKGMPKSEMVSWGELAKRAYLIIPLALLIFLVSSGSRTMQFSAAVSILAAIVVGFLNKDERLTFGKIVEALEAGAKGAITVAVACAMAGMIAGCITVTGLASILINAIVQMAGDATMIGLLLTMICCIILGMGVPTTANYCIMASTCAPILVQMDFPLVAAHFFVFYFGIVADITPPVALAAYAGAAIAKANPMKTGINATKLAVAAFIVPYIFAYSPAMLFDNVSSAFEVVQIVVSALIGLFGVAAALNGFVYKKIPMLFRLAMAAGGLCMMIPGTASDVVGLVVVGGIVLIQRMSARRLAA